MEFLLDRRSGIEWWIGVGHLGSKTMWLNELPHYMKRLMSLHLGPLLTILRPLIYLFRSMRIIIFNLVHDLLNSCSLLTLCKFCFYTYGICRFCFEFLLNVEITISVGCSSWFPFTNANPQIDRGFIYVQETPVWFANRFGIETCRWS